MMKQLSFMASASLVILSTMSAAAAPSPEAEAWFQKGVAAEQRGAFGEAADAYQRALAYAPDAGRIKLNLARVRHAQGQDGEAQRLFHEVRETNPPAPVVANIDRFLAMMNDRNKTGHAWRARATAGAGYDSNPGTATSAREVTMWGLPFTLSKDAQRRGSAFAFFKGEFDHIYRFGPEFAWVSNLSFGARKHATTNNYDNFNGSVSTGPVWQPDGKTIAMLPVYANVNRFETSTKKSADRWHSWEYRIAPQVRYAATDWLNLNIVTNVGRRTYFKDSSKDATFGSISPSVDIRTPSAGTFTLGLTGGREVARTSFNSNKNLGFNVGWQYAFAKNLMGSAYATYTDSRYDQRESPYPEKRHDRRTVAGVDFIYNWEEIGSELLLSYSHTWNLSNLPLYRYDRDTVSLAVRKSF